MRLKSNGFITEVVTNTQPVDGQPGYMVGCSWKDNAAPTPSVISRINVGTLLSSERILSCSCPPVPGIVGCMNPNATNYNPLATIDDNSCTYE